MLEANPKSCYQLKKIYSEATLLLSLTLLLNKFMQEFSSDDQSDDLLLNDLNPCLTPCNAKSRSKVINFSCILL